MGLRVTILGGFRGRKSLNLRLPSTPTHDQTFLLTFTFGVTGNMDSEGDPTVDFYPPVSVAIAMEQVVSA